MNQKLSQLLAPRFGLYFLVMAAFAIITLLLGRVDVAVGELIIVAILFGVYWGTLLRRRREAASYLEQLVGSMDGATRDSTLNCPLPVAMFRPDTDEVLWTNDRFLRLTGEQEGMFDTKMADLVPSFDSRWLLEGKNECPQEVAVGNRRYQVFGSVARTAGQEEGALATTYWVDVTELANTRDVYKATRPAVALLLLDNYEDTIKGQEDSVRSALLNAVSQKFTQWAQDTDGIFCRLELDRYLYLFEEQYLDGYKAEKFSLLDSVRTASRAPTVSPSPCPSAWGWMGTAWGRCSASHPYPRRWPCPGGATKRW